MWKVPKSRKATEQLYIILLDISYSTCSRTERKLHFLGIILTTFPFFLWLSSCLKGWSDKKTAHTFKKVVIMLFFLNMLSFFCFHSFANVVGKIVSQFGHLNWTDELLESSPKFWLEKNLNSGIPLLKEITSSRS